MSPMETDERAAFVNGYTKILTAAWSSEEFSLRLETDPVSVLVENGLAVEADAHVEIVRSRDGDPDLRAQLHLWEVGRQWGHYVLYVPDLPQLEVRDLGDEELDGLAGGGGGGSYCCSPCCCQA